MRYTVILLFITSTLFANYAYQGENGGKIDMHGGKKQKLVEDKQNLSNKSFMFGNIGLKNEKKIEEKTKEDKQKNKK